MPTVKYQLKATLVTAEGTSSLMYGPWDSYHEAVTYYENFVAPERERYRTWEIIETIVVSYPLS